MIGPLAPKGLVLPRCNAPVWHGLLGERKWRLSKWSGLMTLEELSIEAVPVGIAARSKQFSHQRIPIHPKVLWLLAYLQYSTNYTAPIWDPITTMSLRERNFREFHCIEHSQPRWPFWHAALWLKPWKTKRLLKEKWDSYPQKGNIPEIHASALYVPLKKKKKKKTNVSIGLEQL